jgi:hypothetical protein
MADLAETYWNQGRWKEAEELKVQALETRKRVLGEEHPDTLTSIASLALTYSKQGRWKEAEELNVQVMETMQRVLGEEHPEIILKLTRSRTGSRTRLNRSKRSGESAMQRLEPMTNM